jgi:hypothetical protein
MDKVVVLYSVGSCRLRQFADVRRRLCLQVVAEILSTDGKPRVQLCYNEIQTLQTDLDKFLEDVRYVDKED